MMDLKIIIKILKKNAAYTVRESTANYSIYCSWVHIQYSIKTYISLPLLERSTVIIFIYSHIYVSIYLSTDTDEVY
jgi:hypothetical protein